MRQPEVHEPGDAEMRLLRPLELCERPGPTVHGSQCATSPCMGAGDDGGDDNKGYVPESRVLAGCPELREAVSG